MNLFTAMVRSLPAGVRQRHVVERQERDEQAKSTERKRGYYQAKKKRANGLTRDEQQAADRVAWLAAVLAALEKEEPMSSVALGRAMGTTRCCAFRRLTIMEQDGYVERLGTAEKTKWMRK